MILLLTLALFCVDGIPPASQPREESYFPPKLYLVRATTVKMWQEPKAIHETGLLRVTKVIAGPNSLIDREFTCLAGSRKPFASGFGPGRDTPLNGVVEYLEKDAEGLWWVYEDPDYLTLKPELRYKVVEQLRLHDFPFQKTKKLDVRIADLADPRLSDVKLEKVGPIWEKMRLKDPDEWVEAVAAVYSTKTDDGRRELLEKYASAPNSPVSAWAIVLLGRGPKDRSGEFLRELAKNEKIDPDARITLDRILCQLDGKKWVQSKTRREMLGHWLDVKATGYLFTVGCRRLEDGLHAGEVDAELLAAVAAHAVANSGDLTDPQIRAFSRLIGQIRFKAVDREKGMAFFTEVLANSKPTILRWYAASGLRQFRPLSADEIVSVRRLREREKDKVIIAELDAICAPAK